MAADRPRLWRGFVLGMHSFDKLAETYEEGAINLASLARTKLILATADKNTAEVCSNFIGFREVRETDEAYSIGEPVARCGHHHAAHRGQAAGHPGRHHEPAVAPRLCEVSRRLSGSAHPPPLA
jgi:hypothetical protein